MAKKTAVNVSSGFASQTQINNEFADIADHLNNKVLYRTNPTGEPNQMNNDMDMNSNRILNLPAPVSPFEPARYADIGGYADAAAASATTSAASATTASSFATQAGNHADSAAASAATAASVASVGLDTASLFYDFGVITDTTIFFPTDFGSVV